jgi:hypothetical protein
VERARVLVLGVVGLRADAGGRELHAGGLAHIGDAAALVHAGAGLEHLVEREPVGVAAGPAGLAGDDVRVRIMFARTRSPLTSLSATSRPFASNSASWSVVVTTV